jgi:tetratricopeptide (TPR) repeat protein
VQGNGLCLQCHRADAYDTRAHHFHKKIHEGKPSDGAHCVKCHMPETPYMVVDERADHSIRIPRPDLTQSIGTPNACSQKNCHGNRPLSWVVDAFTKWYGEAKKPHYATVLAAGREGAPEGEKELGKLAGDPLFPAIVRATALMLLGNYHSEESLTVFEKTLLDEEGLVRYAALRYMPRSRDPKRVVENVVPLLFDPLMGVRTQAAVLLADAPRDLLKPYQREALDKGLQEYEEALAHSLDFSASGYNMGNLYSRLGRNKEAEAYYRRAIAVDDLFYPAKVNLSVLLNAEGRNQEAEKLLREVVSAYPEQYEAHYSLGLLLGELHKYEEAARYLSIAAKGMPGHEGAKRNLAAIREYLRQVEAQGTRP